MTERTALITGGTGFIGTHLVDACRPDARVRVLDHDLGDVAKQLQADDGVELYPADVCNLDAVRTAMDGVDVVYHLAAVANVAQPRREPLATHRVNVGGTLAVLEAARQVDADPRVVVASSAAIYGDPPRLPIHESHPPNARSMYGIQKLAADRYATAYHELYGLETVVVRPFNVYGPVPMGRTPDVVSIFVDQARRGGPITVHGDGAQTRDFVHVRDVADAFRRAGLLGRSLGIGSYTFNVGTGEGTSIATIAERVAELAGGDVAIEHSEARPNDIQASVADIGKATTWLGWEPTVGLDEGLEGLMEGDR